MMGSLPCDEDCRTAPPHTEPPLQGLVALFVCNFLFAVTCMYLQGCQVAFKGHKRAGSLGSVRRIWADLILRNTVDKGMQRWMAQAILKPHDEIF